MSSSLKNLPRRLHVPLRDQIKNLNFVKLRKLPFKLSSTEKYDEGINHALVIILVTYSGKCNCVLYPRIAFFLSLFWKTLIRLRWMNLGIFRHLDILFSSNPIFSFLWNKDHNRWYGKRKKISVSTDAPAIVLHYSFKLQLYIKALHYSLHYSFT